MSTADLGGLVDPDRTEAELLLLVRDLGYSVTSAVRLPHGLATMLPSLRVEVAHPDGEREHVVRLLRTGGLDDDQLWVSTQGGFGAGVLPTNPTRGGATRSILEGRLVLADSNYLRRRESTLVGRNLDYLRAAEVRARFPAEVVAAFVAEHSPTSVARESLLRLDELDSWDLPRELAVVEALAEVAAEVESGVPLEWALRRRGRWRE